MTGTHLTASVRPIAHIQERVAAEFGLKTFELRGQRRNRNIARPRQLAMYLASRLTRKSLPTIGAVFDRDHTTVMHGIEVMERELARDPALAETARRLYAELLTEIGQTTPLEETIDEVIEMLRGRLKALARRNPAHLVSRLNDITGTDPLNGGLS